MLSDAKQRVIAEIDRQLEPIKAKRITAQEELADLLQAEEMLEKARAQFKANGKDKRGADEKTVREVCIETAEENAPIPKADLEGLAKDKLRDRGFSLTGVHRRMQKCLSGPPFIIDADQRVALAES